MIWCLSPLIGFFLTPIMGSMSDRCSSNLGRRRPFIIILSIGVILGMFEFSARTFSHFSRQGLILVPNGKWMGKQLGDRYPAEEALESLNRNEEFESHEGPGGRMFGIGQMDDEEKILTKFKQEDQSKVLK